MDLSDGTTVDFLIAYDYSETYPLDAEMIAARQKEIIDLKQIQFDVVEHEYVRFFKKGYQV